MGSLENEPLINQAAERAAREAVRETFRLLGIDIDEQGEVNDFRADLVYARKMRRLSEKTAVAAFIALAAAVGGGIVSLFWDGLKAALLGRH